jgi:arabinogalactan endo-1,4-beta-galactosidase
MKFYSNILFFVALINLSSCQNAPEAPDEPEKEIEKEITFYYGADLSYVNEMEDCGAVYKNSQGISENPYKIVADAGANLVRVRLWNNPTWTNYSNLSDVKETISKAKQQKMKVLLDFHYSDTWADPSNQLIPAAWENQINNTEALGELLYNYTFNTLSELKKEGLTPDIVQIGNEINPMILQSKTLVWPINWTRNA